MKSDYLPKDIFDLTETLLDGICKEMAARHADLDEIYHICLVDEKSNIARQRAFVYGSLRDVKTAFNAIRTYKNTYKVKKYE